MCCLLRTYKGTRQRHAQQDQQCRHDLFHWQVCMLHFTVAGHLWRDKLNFLALISEIFERHPNSIATSLGRLCNLLLIRLLSVHSGKHSSRVIEGQFSRRQQ